MLFLQVLSGIIALLALCLTYNKIWKGEEIGQNFVSWFLWGILDAITAIATIAENGNFILPSLYSLGAFSVSYLLIKKKQVVWSLVEFVTIPLVLICLLIWWKTGNINSIIACTFAIFLSGVPQIKDSWEEPFKTPIGIYLLFSLAELFSFIGGKSWIVEEKLYAGAQLVLCFFIIIFSLKKYFLTYKTKGAY